MSKNSHIEAKAELTVVLNLDKQVESQIEIIRLRIESVKDELEFTSKIVSRLEKEILLQEKSASYDKLSSEIKRLKRHIRIMDQEIKDILNQKSINDQKK